MSIGDRVKRTTDALLKAGAWKATLYVSPTEIVRVTRRWYGRQSAKAKINTSTEKADLIVTIGRPNYEERDFVKKCRKAGEPFPLKKVQLKFKKA